MRFDCVCGFSSTRRRLKCPRCKAISLSSIPGGPQALFHLIMGIFFYLFTRPDAALFNKPFLITIWVAGGLLLLWIDWQGLKITRLARHVHADNLRRWRAEGKPSHRMRANAALAGSVEYTPRDDRIERPFRRGLLMTLKATGFLLFLLIAGVGVQMARLEALLGEPIIPWTLIAITPLVVGSLCFGYSYLGSRIGERKAQLYLTLILAPAILLLIYWMVNRMGSVA
ncbi:MAG: hypothetical protein JJU36_11625 [Phycisphaeraceae bacterium]|nr:hypothetical protein [Phycisphaeraceae bacterium]